MLIASRCVYVSLLQCKAELIRAPLLGAMLGAMKVQHSDLPLIRSRLILSTHVSLVAAYSSPTLTERARPLAGCRDCHQGQSNRKSPLPAASHISVSVA